MAAAQAIAEKGLEEVRMTDIAERAACTTGMVNYYFTDKEAVLWAALQYVNSAMGERMLRHIHRFPKDLRGAMALALPLDPRTRDEWTVWMPFWARAATSARHAEEMTARYVVYIRGITHALSTGIEHGLIDSAIDIEMEAHNLAAHVDGIGLRAMFDPDTWTAKRQLAHLDHYMDRLVGS